MSEMSVDVYSVGVRPKSNLTERVYKDGMGIMAMRLAPTLVLNDGPKLITDVLAVVFLVLMILNNNFLGGGFKYFLFSPLLEEGFQFD